MRCKACDCVIEHPTTNEVIIEGKTYSVNEELCSWCRREGEKEITITDIFGSDNELQESLGDGNYITLSAPDPDDM